MYTPSDRHIAAASPAEKLEVAGNVKATGTIQAGSSITIDGTANTITSSADLELYVSSGRVLRLEANATSPNVIGGHPDNSVTNGVNAATIAGGGQGGGLNNSVTNEGGTVGGGIDNAATGISSTVAGGQGNTADDYGHT